MEHSEPGSLNNGGAAREGGPQELRIEEEKQPGEYKNAHRDADVQIDWAEIDLEIQRTWCGNNFYQQREAMAG